jgi:hypothetical protein
MLYFEADPRDSAPLGNTCNTCCCEPLALRPGETNLIAINFAAWAVPIGRIVPTFEYSIDQNDDACSTAAIDGFGPPSNSNFSGATTPLNTALPFNLNTTAQPAANTFTYRVLPLEGPNHGTVANNNAGVLTYTPNNGFEGWDHFWYETKDAQGRTVRYPVVAKIGNAGGASPRQWSATQPFIDISKIKTNENSMMVSFPIYMPLTCRGCESYRLTIKQPASDCDRTIFNHYSCFDIRCKDC